MLLYSLLHLTGYDLTLDDLKAFRQWGSMHARPPGVRPDAGRRGDDRAAGPGLRQRASAWRSPSGGWRTSSTGDGHAIVDHRVVRDRARTATSRRASPREAASLAGHLRLGKLIYLYDDNHIQLDGPTVDGLERGRPRALRRLRLAHPAGRGRQRHRGDRGRDRGAPRRTTAPASSPSGPTSATAARTGRTPRRRTASPLGEDEVRLTKEAYGWDPDAHVLRPRRGRASTSRRVVGRGETLVDDWDAVATRRYRDAFPDLAAEFDRRLQRQLRPTAGTAASSATRPARSWRRATRARRRSRRWPRRSRSCSAARPTCPSRT